VAVFADLGTRLAGEVVAFPASASGGQGTKTGIEIVEDEIKDVLTTLRTELETLETSTFPSEGHIRQVSFGVGAESDDIAYHHGRAHSVVVDTLRGLIKDLEAFELAVIDAKGMIGKSDEEAEADLLVLVDRTESLDLGQQGARDAQHDNVNAGADDQPDGDTLGDDPDSPDSPDTPADGAGEGAGTDQTSDETQEA
jgi:hypothetical protein